MLAKKRIEVFRISRDLAGKVIEYCKETGKDVEELLNEVMNGIVEESGLGSQSERGKVLVKDVEIKIAVPTGLDRKLVSIANGKGLTKFQLVRERLRQVVNKV